MALRDIAEILLTYFQYMALLVSIQPSPYPAFYRLPLDFLYYLNLDLDRILFGDRNQEVGSGDGRPGWVPTFLPLDIRLQFILVSVAVPLLLAVGAVVLMATRIFVVWYTFTTLAVLLTVVGLFAIITNDQIVISTIGAQNILLILVGGGGTLIICVICALGYRLQQKRKEERERRRTYDQIIEEEVTRVDFGGVVFKFAYMSVSLFFGLLFLNLFPFNFIDHNSLGVFGLIIGIVLVVYAGILFIWILVGACERGRFTLFKVGEFVQNNFLSVLLLFISFLYVPAVSNVILIINCSDVTCPAYTRIVDKNSVLPSPNASLTTSEQCETCWYGDTPQLCSSELQTSSCYVEHVSSRLIRNRNVACDDLVIYFWPACGVMFVSFVISTPFVNYYLTRTSTRALVEEFPLDARQAVGLTDEEAFQEKVELSDNVAKFIYDPFQLRWRHWRMLYVFQKLAIVWASVFVWDFVQGIDTAQMGLALSVFVHFICLLYVVITRPFKRRIENVLTITTQMLLFLTAGIGLVGATGAPLENDIAQGFMIALAVAILALPFLVLIPAAILTTRDQNEQMEWRKKRIFKAIEAAEKADEDEYNNPDDPYAGTMMKLPSFYQKGEKNGKAEKADSPKKAGKKKRGEKNDKYEDENEDVNETSIIIEREDCNEEPPPRIPRPVSFLGGEEGKEKGRRRSVSFLPPERNEIGAKRDTDELSLMKCESVASEAGPPPPHHFSPHSASPKEKGGTIAPHYEDEVDNPMRRTPAQAQAMVPPKLGSISVLKGIRTNTEEAPSTSSLQKNTNSVVQNNVFLGVGSNTNAPGSPRNNFGSYRAALDAIVGKRSQEASADSRPRVGGALGALLALRAQREARLEHGRHSLHDLANETSTHHEKNWSEEVMPMPMPVPNPLSAQATAKKLARNMKKAIKKNTPEQSKRARERWMKAKLFVLSKVRAGETKGTRGKRGKQTKMGGWDKLLVMLLSKDAKNGKGDKMSLSDEIEMQLNAGGSHEAIREKLKTLYQEHLDRITVQQQTVDFRINQDTLDTLNIYFFVTGLLAFVALGFVTLGIIQYTSTINFHPVWHRGTTHAEFAAYSSWDEFTQECCCTPHPNVNVGYTLGDQAFHMWDVEKWVCSNGHIKERVRQKTLRSTLATVSPAVAFAMNQTNASGIGLRALCGIEWLTDCRPGVVDFSVSLSRETNVSCADFLEKELDLW